jgi:RNA polymerase sigma factor (sigma-70 family)
MSTPDPGAADLIALARQGDVPAIERLFIRTVPDLRAFIEPRIGRRWRPYVTSDDILQATLIDAYTDIAGFVSGGEDSLMRWLKQIARNRTVDAIRDISRLGADGASRQPRALTGLGAHLTLVRTLLATRSSMGQGAILGASEARDLLHQALKDLPEQYRLVIERFDLQGRPASEIAAELHKTVGAVYLMRRRGLDKLRALLDPNLTKFS